MDKFFSSKKLPHLIENLNFSSDEKVFINKSEIGNEIHHEIAYLHTAVIRNTQKVGSNLASCITILATSRVEPGIVVQIC